MIDHGLVDIWWACHPEDWEGTFISTAHMWSRLDYWLVTRKASAWVSDICHLPRTLSDHTPAWMSLVLHTNIPKLF